MKYTICSRQKDILSLMWNVFASFGYKDAVYDNCGKDTNDGFARIAVDEGLKCKLMLCGCKNEKAMSELAAVSIEAALAAELPDFCLEISCSDDVAELLYLYGLDEYCDIKSGNFEFIGKSGKVVVFKGNAEGNGLVCDFDISAACEALKNDAFNISVPETVIFAEKSAEGIAYEIAYTMHLSGCLVTNYLDEGTIEDCEEYAKGNNAQSIIRVFSNGKIQIKELVSGEITETDYNTFVGYYDEPAESDCDCGHEHHHGHDCDCGRCH